MKHKTLYRCTNCTHTTMKWIGCCPQCNEWNSFIEDQKEEAFKPAGSIKGHHKAATLATLTTIETHEHSRMRADIDEWDRVLGGGILPGSFLILTGDPGVGKSTLLLQIAHRISQSNKVIYFSSEESLNQVKNRAVRLASTSEQLFFSDNSSLETIIETAKQEKPDLLIVDSIQNCHFATTHAIPGTVAQLREAGFHLMKLAKENTIAVLVTGHITKDGYMAGPKLLEHMVDGVFYLQGDEQWHTRILRSVKNRFGTINEIGFFEMIESGLQPVSDINKNILQERSPAAGSMLISSLEGSRFLLIEVQALCVTSKFGIPQRVISGLDPKQVILIAAILEKYLKVRFSAHDIFFKISGNLKIKNSSSDLGIALALLSSYFQKPLPEHAIALGEISLTGHIKTAPHMNRCISEAEQFGIQTIYCARGQTIKTTSTLTPFKHVYELLNLFPED